MKIIIITLSACVLISRAFLCRLMHNSSPENGCEGDLIETQLNLHWITDTFDIFLTWYLQL